DEAAAGDLRAGGEVEAAAALADVDVVLHWEVELARIAPAALLAVLLGRGAERHRFVRDVRHAAQEILDLLLQLTQRLLRAFQQELELLALLEQRRDVQALRLRQADVLGDAV